MADVLDVCVPPHKKQVVKDGMARLWLIYYAMGLVTGALISTFFFFYWSGWRL